MGKKKKKQRKAKRDNGQKTPQVKLLDQWLDCNETCNDIGTLVRREYDDMYSRSDYFADNLPGFSFVETQFVNYIFADGMSAGGVEQDEQLNNFRFKLNRQNISNNAVLRDAIRLAQCRHGECGVRWLDGDLYTYLSGTYAPLTMINDGIEEIVAYVATNDGKRISDREFKAEDLTWVSETHSLYEFEKYFRDNELVLLDKSEFVNLRNDTSKLHGDPPLERDRQRLELLLSVYERLNYDIDFDGPGRILLPVKQGHIGDGVNEVSTTQLLDATMKGTQNRTNKALLEGERIASDIKASTSDSVIVVSPGFDKPVHLPRVTKATEFFEWVAKEGEIIADVIGLPPSLLEEGQLSGNVSMTRIVDNAMTEAIIPMREHYASQLSPMLSEHLGVEKVYFTEYELQSAMSSPEKWSKIAATMYQLNTIQGDEEVRKVISDFAKMLDYDIHDSVGDVIEI